MKQYIYADNAATTKLDIDAYEAMRPYLLESYGNASQPYSFARSPKKAIKEAREIIAKCIGATPEEIIFTSGGTESDNWAIKCVDGMTVDRKTIITSEIEHHAVLNACRSIKAYGLIGLIIYNKQENRFSLEGEKLPHLFTIHYYL